jgi:sporulation protein YlmC with PRC-barrel domain
MEREGYQRVKMTDVSTEMLMGKTVHDTNDSVVGTVTDILLDGDGQITDVIIDFGGFLGVGSNQASLEYEELTILARTASAD